MSSGDEFAVICKQFPVDLETLGEASGGKNRKVFAGVKMCRKMLRLVSRNFPLSLFITILRHFGRMFTVPIKSRCFQIKQKHDQNYDENCRTAARVVALVDRIAITA